MIYLISDKSSASYNSSRLSVLAMLFIFGGLISSPAIAAFLPPPTGAGQLDNQIRQHDRSVLPAPVVPSITLPADKRGSASAPESSARVTLKHVTFTGVEPIPSAHGVTETALQKVVAPWLDRPLSFSDMQAMTEVLTQYYRDSGALVARVILPPQTIRDGVLTVQIISGAYDSAVLSGGSGLRDSQAMRVISAAAPVGTVVTRGSLERMALLLSEVPGVEAHVALKAGTLPGTSAPEVTLSPGKRFGGYTGLDNQGDPTTGRSRVMAGAYVNELLGYGDQLRIDLLDAYEKSNLFNGSVDYSLLAGGYGTRIGANYSHLNYHYNFLQRAFNGYSDNWNLYVTHPWIRAARARVDLRAEGGEQYLTDKYPADLYRGLGEEGRKRVMLGAVSVAGSVADVPGGVTGFSVKGTVGSLDYRNDLARSINFSRELGAEGQFSRMNWTLNHDQQVWGPFSVYAGLTGQLANHNLDSSQKFLLGGPGAVRAYDVGTGSVDNGTVATGEVRWTHAIPQGSWTKWMGASPSVTAAAFYDQGWGAQYAQNRNQEGEGRLTDHNHVNLSGAGFYTTVVDAGNYALTITWAHRTGNVDPSLKNADHNRVWVSAVKSF